MTIIVRACSIEEIKFKASVSGIELCFEAESGDRFHLELADEVVGSVIKELAYYAWNMVFEEDFMDVQTCEDPETKASKNLPDPFFDV